LRLTYNDAHITIIGWEELSIAAVSPEVRA
jgi:hypothetical protein